MAGVFDQSAFDADVFDVGEAAVTLAATVAGFSTVAATLTNGVPLAAASTGSSTVSGALSATTVLIATSAGSSMVAADVHIDIALSGTSAGSSSVAGIIATTIAGVSTGSSTVTGTLSRTLGLAATPAGSSTVTSAVSRDRGVDGIESGTSYVTAELTADIGLEALVEGSSSVTGNMTADVLLAASVAGFSTVTASISTYIAASVAGASSVTANLTSARGLAALSTGKSTVAADVMVTSIKSLVPVLVRGRSVVSGSLTGGTVALTWSISGTYPDSSASVTAPAAAGTSTVTVDDGSIFTQGQTIYINGIPYMIESISGDTLTLGSALLTNVEAGDLVEGELDTAINATSIAVANRTRYDLDAAIVREPILADMQARHPAYVRSQVRERQINLDVYFLANTYSQRRIDYESFESALDSLTGLVSLRWTDENGVTREYLVTALSVSPDAWFHRASAVLIAAEPEARAVA